MLAEAASREALIDGHCRLEGKQRDLRLGLIPAAEWLVFGALAVLARSEQGAQTSVCHVHKDQGGFRPGCLPHSV